MGGKSEFIQGVKKTAGKSKAKKAGLTFPVARIGQYMKKGRFADRTFFWLFLRWHEHQIFNSNHGN